MASRNVLTIWNQALSHIGVRAAVQSQTEATREAQHLNAVWELTRDAELELFDWNFLTAHRSLSALSETAPDSWSYVYQYPSDCLKFRYIEGIARTDADPIPYELGNGTGGSRVIFTDEESAVGWYSKVVNDPHLWSAQFCMALAWKLGVSLAMTEVGSSRDSATMEKLYAYEMDKAKVQSANEEQRDPFRDSEGIRERE